MNPETYDNFPWWMVAACNAVGLGVYAICFSPMIRPGIVWGLAYVAFCLWMEWCLLSGSCRSCHYFGKRCGFGRGKVSSWIFTTPCERPPLAPKAGTGIFSPYRAARVHK